MKFKVGDRVEVIAHEDDYNTVGLLGTVRFIGDGMIFQRVGVEHDCEFWGGNNLNGLCRHGYGLYYYNAENQLMLSANDEPHITADGLEELL